MKDPKARFRKRLDFSANDTKRIYQIITKIDTLNTQWQFGNQLSIQTINQLQASVIVTSTGASNRIEGNQLTDEQVRELYQRRSIKNLKNRDEQEVAGYLELLQNVFRSFEDLSFSENLIRNFHQEILKYSEKDQRHRGNYKFTSNTVEAIDEKGKVVGIIFEPTPQFLVPKEMQELVEWTKNELEIDEYPKLLVIANFVFEFLAIHPFQDGNGRCSRILTNLLLLQQGYDFVRVVSHEQLVEQNKADYYVALNQTQQTWKKTKENMLPWLYFFLKTTLLQAEKALLLSQKEETENWLSEKQQIVWNTIQNVDTPFAKSEIVQITGLNTRTVEASLKKLVTMGKLKRIGEGRGVRYVFV